MELHWLCGTTLSLVLLLWVSPVRCQAQCNAGTAARQKRIVIRSPGAGQLGELDRCQYRVAPWSTQVCQVRIDFERLELPQPQLNASTGTVECGDFLQVQRFRLCGRSSGQHLYVPLHRGQELQLLFVLATPLSRQQSTWQMTLTQLECPRDSLAVANAPKSAVEQPRVRPFLPFMSNLLPRTIFGGETGIGSGQGPAAQLIQSLRSPSQADLELLAPMGCDQYWRSQTGGIVSFNFAGGIYMPSMRYSICVKGALDSEISYKIEHFELSKTDADRAGPGYDTDCRSTVRTAGRVSDYLLIPNSYVINQPELQPTYYCGNGMAGRELVARPPFVIHFSSDAQTSASETGFQLTYAVRQSQEQQQQQFQVEL
ncbi:uncharacterized protein LOC108161511 [Drosophila miranda]|uniref:uncharacterized protein LOC108161511 n=1 Tax=Drosophila miranda TaxID=7229 RepID=UPI0007E6D687|nr:uncharacterized protein LOC108161511 [Drosophila miranda]